ncbi:MAG: GNAT family N-acetyltransferase [Caldisericia bacterium]|nr:GNAT family N-acetyltransferase [Caldisericia bacterium]
MRIVRLNKSNLQDSVDIIIEAFGDQYRRLFGVSPVRLKHFVKLSLETGETWVLGDSEVKGVLVLKHKLHEGTGYGDIFKILAKSIPFWSIVYSARYVLAPKIVLKDSVHISQIGVSKASRNQGVGFQLLEFAQTRAKELGFGSINLRVRADNPAVNLYKRFGFTTFREISSVVFSSTSGCKTVFYMVKNLVP